MMEYELLFKQKVLVPITNISISPDHRLIATTGNHSPIIQVIYLYNQLLIVLVLRRKITSKYLYP